MKSPRYEIADVIRLYKESFLARYPQGVQVLKTLQAIEDCRTEKLGGHKLRCNSCGKESYSYNSCRNRHCPKCQTVDREKWMMARENDLLPVPYYHIVFTLPDEINQYLKKHAKVVYSSLFTAVWQTIQKLSKDPKYLGAKPGMISILHTWGEQLMSHPHIHCIVPGGGITKEGKWRAAKYGDKYLFSQMALSKIFRAKFIKLLRKHIKVDYHTAKRLFSKPWIVNVQRPFAGPLPVIKYLGRYTHKIAISNHRIVNIKNGKVSFLYKDYRNKGIQKTMTLDAIEFLRRFCLHVLPHGFVRIRHFGILASRNKPTDLNALKQQLTGKKWKKLVISWQQVAEIRLGINIGQCPKCKKGTMEIVAVIAPQRGPPVKYFTHDQIPIIK